MNALTGQSVNVRNRRAREAWLAYNKALRVVVDPQSWVRLPEHEREAWRLAAEAAAGPYAEHLESTAIELGQLKGALPKEMSTE